MKLAQGPSTGAQASRQEQQRARKDAYYLIYERVDEEGEGKEEKGREARVPTEEEIKALVPAALRVCKPAWLVVLNAPPFPSSDANKQTPP